MNFESNNWSSQIEEYKNGTLSADARHQLEKAALDDDFLFDALEGYSIYANTGAQSDREVKPGAKANSKVFSLRNIAVAASLVLLVGIVGYMNSAVKTNDQFADLDSSIETDEAPPATIAMNSDLPPVEAVKKGNGNVQETIESEAEAQPKVKVNEPKPTIKKTKEKVKNTAVDGVSIQSKTTNSKALTNVEADESELTVENTTDIAGDENVPTKAKNTTLKSERPSLLANQDLSSGKAKQSLSMAPVNTDRSESIQLASPASGWTAFEKYINDNKKKITLLKPATITVMFLVGTDGQVSNIKALPSSCSDCAAEAIRLISESGNWTSKSGTPQTVEYLIKF